MNILVWTLSQYLFLLLSLVNKNVADIIHSYIVGFAGAGRLEPVTAWHDWIFGTWGLAEGGEYAIPDFPFQDEHGRSLKVPLGVEFF